MLYGHQPVTRSSSALLLRAGTPAARFCGARRVLSGTAIAGLLLLVSGCGGGAPEARAPEPAERAVAVAAVEMVPQDLSLTLQLSGTLEPLREVRIAARTSGILRQVLVEEGRRVRAGDVLARFDVAEQQAELARARTVLQNAEATYRRAAEMRERQLISEVDYERAQADRNIARSEVRLWETRTGLGTVRAPSAGVVTAKFVEAGNAVSSGEPLFVVADVSTLVLRIGVTDTYAARLTEGQDVRVEVDAMPDRSWAGTLRRIFPAADPDTRLHPVEFALRPGGGSPPAPGYLARVAVDVERRPGVLAVPNEALLASSGEQPFVFAIENDRLVRKHVVAGASRRDWTEMVEGLAPGDLVVASNPANLREGMLVRVTERIAPPGDAPS
jgi:membrane fusion protein, multidrug efflux system